MLSGKIYKWLALLLGSGACMVNVAPAQATEAMCPGGANQDPAVIWCDDFEDATPLQDKYYEFNDVNGGFERSNSDSFNGDYSLRARWKAGEVDVGHLMYNFGRNPIGTQGNADTDFREIYWRFYIKLQDGFSGYPDKLTRATVFAGANWQQAMIAHLWASTDQREYLMIDPASGIDSNSRLATTKWNDFDNLSWLGYKKGITPLSAGQWYCIETHVKLNSTGSSDGVFEYWINGKLEAGRQDLNWVKDWAGYGINSIFLETYWNSGSPAEQSRYLDKADQLH
ncbi:MAG: hypothetical protein HY889_10690 [Deltaproteobacteria bacterium]|nr:hypothetical protein [Deltaproteobacteria bacterium]